MQREYTDPNKEYLVDLDAKSIKDLKIGDPVYLIELEERFYFKKHWVCGIEPGREDTEIKVHIEDEWGRKMQPFYGRPWMTLVYDEKADQRVYITPEAAEKRLDDYAKEIERALETVREDLTKD